MQAVGVMQVVQYQVSTPRSAIAAEVPQHYVPPPPYFGNYYTKVQLYLVNLIGHYYCPGFVLEMSAYIKINT